MAEKVVLKKEQAKALEELKKIWNYKESDYYVIIDEKYSGGWKSPRFSAANTIQNRVFVKAILNGFEVEKEKLVFTEYQTNLINKLVTDIKYTRIGKKTTVAVLILTNGFEVIGTSACVNPEDYNKEIGEHYAVVDALSKLDELNGYLLQ